MRHQLSDELDGWAQADAQESHQVWVVHAGHDESFLKQQKWPSYSSMPKDSTQISHRAPEGNACCLSNIQCDVRCNEPQAMGVRPSTQMLWRLRSETLHCLTFPSRYMVPEPKMCDTPDLCLKVSLKTWKQKLLCFLNAFFHLIGNQTIPLTCSKAPSSSLLWYDLWSSCANMV